MGFWGFGVPYVGLDFYGIVICLLFIGVIKLIVRRQHNKEKGKLMKMLEDYSENLYFRTFCLRFLIEVYF